MECAWLDICLGQGISEWMWISLYFYDICYSSEDGFIPGTLSWVDMLLFYFGTFFLSNYLLVHPYKNAYMYQIYSLVVSYNNVHF